MGKKRHEREEEEIIAKLRRDELLVGPGMARVDAIREVRIAEQTSSRRRK